MYACKSIRIQTLLVLVEDKGACFCTLSAVSGSIGPISESPVSYLIHYDRHAFPPYGISNQQ